MKICSYLSEGDVPPFGYEGDETVISNNFLFEDFVNLFLAIGSACQDVCAVFDTIVLKICW